MSNTAQSIIALLTRVKTREFTLDDGVVIKLKSLSMGAIEGLQAKVKELENDENQLKQFVPILQAAVEGLEEVELEHIRGFLLEDLKKIADEVMNLGK